MGFTTKKVQQKTRGISFIKGATLFFLGTSCVLFVARAFDITPSVPNAVQYIQQIFLTTSGANTPGTNRISLDGINGNGIFSGTVSANTISGTNIKGTTITGSTICLIGDTCITQWPTGGTASVTTAAGLASNIQFNAGSGVFSGVSSFYWYASGYDKKINILGSAGTNSIYMGTDDYTETAYLRILNTEGNTLSIDGGSDWGKIMNQSEVPLLFGTDNIERMKIDASGVTVSGNIKLQNSGWINAGAYPIVRLDATNGYIGIKNPNPSTELDVNGTVTAVSYLYNSDKRLKTDITSLTDPLKKILSLNGYLFTWKKTGTKDMGVIAQEVEKVFPEIVHTNNEGYKSVEYGNLVAPLIEAIKALNTKIDAQAKEIAALKTKK